MKLVAALFIICSIVLILIILIQKGKGGGLSGALGGGIASGLLGSKTGDFLTWATIVVVGVFLLLALVMAKFYKPSISEIGSSQEVKAQAASGGASQTRPATSEEASAGMTQPSAPEQVPAGTPPTEGEQKGTAPMTEANSPRR
jgi:preprotein translocase subunit SecG